MSVISCAIQLGTALQSVVVDGHVVVKVPFITLGETLIKVCEDRATNVVYLKGNTTFLQPLVEILEEKGIEVIWQND